MEKHQPPKTVREIGIILSYMNEDIAETKELLKGINGFYATKDEHQSLKDRVKVLEDKSSSKPGGMLEAKEKLILSLATVATAIGVILTSYFGVK